MKTKKKKGFTLTELIVVIVIIGVLAAVLIPSLTGYITKAQNAKDETLVISLNRELNLRKLDDNLNFYTYSDVQAYLESVGMANLEVANKDNIILFDAEDYEFILVKKDEIDTKLEVNSYVYHISEYYSIKKYDEENVLSGRDNAKVLPLSTKKLVSSTYVLHRAFIVSINGNDIVKAIAEFAKINGNTSQSDLDTIISNFNKLNVSDEFKTLWLNSLTKTLFVSMNLEGTDVNMIYVSETYKVKIDLSDLNQSSDDQYVTRFSISSDVSEINLDGISNLNQSTIIIPETVDIAITTSNLTNSNITLTGNKSALSEIDKNTYSYKESVSDCILLNMLNEYFKISTKVKNEQQLFDVLNFYKNMSKPDFLSDFAEKNGIETTSITYSTLLSEYNELINNLSKTVTIANDLTITMNHIEIPHGVTLIIPYDDNSNYLSYDGTISKIAIKDKESKAKVNLSVSEKVTIDCYGNIMVGGILNTKTQPVICNTCGDYGQITNNGTINLYGALYAYGYVIGNGEINSIGGTITQPLTIGDFAGGTITSELVFLTSSKSTPFAQYNLINIWCKTILDSNSIYCAMGGVKVNIPLIGESLQKINNVGIVGSSNSLINLTKGSSVTIEYDSNPIIESSSSDRLYYLGKTKITVSGGASTNSISMSLAGYPINTNDFDFPLPYGFEFTFSNGAYSINSDFVLMPGCEMVVDNDATLVINSNSSLSILGNSDMKNYYFTRKDAAYKYPDSLEDAKLKIKGTLIVNGGIGGIVSGDAKAILAIDSKATGTLGEGTSNKYTIQFGCSSEDTKQEIEQMCIIAYETGSTTNPCQGKMYTCNSEKLWGENSDICHIAYESYCGSNKISVNLSDDYVYNNEKIKNNKGIIVFDSDDINAYKLVGLYKDPKLTDEWVFENDTITSNRTLYAKFEKMCVVTFYDRDSNVLMRKVIDSNSKIDSPSSSLGFANIGDYQYKEVEYYYDGNWYTSKDLGTTWNFESNTVSSNVDLYIGLKKYCKVIFYYKNNSITHTQYGEEIIVIEGNSLSSTQIPSNPSSNKIFFNTYDFDYWMIDNKEIDLTTYIFSDDTKIYAEYKY